MRSCFGCGFGVVEEPLAEVADNRNLLFLRLEFRPRFLRLNVADMQRVFVLVAHRSGFVLVAGLSRALNDELLPVAIVVRSAELDSIPPNFTTFVDHWFLILLLLVRFWSRLPITSLLFHGAGSTIPVSVPAGPAPCMAPTRNTVSSFSS